MPIASSESFGHQAEVDVPEEGRATEEQYAPFNGHEGVGDCICGRPQLIAINDNLGHFLFACSAKISSGPWPLRMPIIMMKAVVFMIAPSVMQSRNHLMARLRKFNLPHLPTTIAPKILIVTDIRVVVLRNFFLLLAIGQRDRNIGMGRGGFACWEIMLEQFLPLIIRRCGDEMEEDEVQEPRLG